LSSPLLTEALRLAETTGWLLFPTCGKAPAIPGANGGHGLHDATTDAAQLKRLFHRAPNADGFAVNCGASGLVVLDCDLTPGVDGRDSLMGAGLPWLNADTPRADTPRGGEHNFYAGRSRSRTAVLPGVDIKSEGGYVVLPPASGRAWQIEASPFDVSPAPVPEWLSRLSQSDEKNAVPRTISTSEWAELLEEVPGGRRHDTLLSLAGHLHCKFVDPLVVRILVESFNATRCSPPQDRKDIDRVLSFVADRELRRRGGA